MYARLEYNPCASDRGTWLAIYRNAKDAQTDPGLSLLDIDLTNEQLTELIVMQKIKVVNLDGL